MRAWGGSFPRQPRSARYSLITIILNKGIKSWFTLERFVTAHVSWLHLCRARLFTERGTGLQLATFWPDRVPSNQESQWSESRFKQDEYKGWTKRHLVETKKHTERGRGAWLRWLRRHRWHFSRSLVCILPHNARHCSSPVKRTSLAETVHVAARMVKWLIWFEKYEIIDISLIDSKLSKRNFSS